MFSPYDAGVEQQGRATAIQQQLLDAGAGVSAPHKNFLLFGERDANDIGRVNLLALFGCFCEFSEF